MKIYFLFFTFLLFNTTICLPQLIIDHLNTDIENIPESEIILAKENLHIAYGHTSHGSQITDGMSGLIDFANGGGRGIDLPQNIFQWNDGGTDGALDLHDYAMEGDAGYYPDWYNNTLNYLNNASHHDVNVIMWSWCGQVGGKYSSGALWDEYLGPMTALEQQFTNVIFVYMTGHLDYSDRENTNDANDSIRSFCRNNNKVLFDFADIESYGPDGTCYEEIADDACDYYDVNGDSIGNWAVEYQNTHTEGTDWYYCNAAHSEALNGNLKAYAAWNLFTQLVERISPVSTGNEMVLRTFTGYPNPADKFIHIEITDENSPGIRDIDILNSEGRIIESLRMENSGLTVNTSGYQPGMYIMRVSGEDGVVNKRFSVIHN